MAEVNKDVSRRDWIMLGAVLGIGVVSMPTSLSNDVVLGIISGVCFGLGTAMAAFRFGTKKPDEVMNGKNS